MTSLSALRHPRPLSLTSPRRTISVNISNPRIAEHGSIPPARRGHVRWASLAHFDIDWMTPPPPAPITLEQADTMRQMQQRQQQQIQLESEQRLRQQQELQQTLAKDRAMMMKQQHRLRQQRPGSWSGTITMFKTSAETEEKRNIPLDQDSIKYQKQQQQLQSKQQQQVHERSLSGSSIHSMAPSSPPPVVAAVAAASSSSPFLSKSRTGNRPKSMLFVKGEDQKMRLSTLTSSAYSPQIHLDMNPESSSNSHWDSIHPDFQTDQEE
ncbi:hypothetical protein FBU30_000852 [Linnemannia zychae]|nr:hypothetical protein FBU30_000852 [Linnemannia zychae]